MNTFVKIPEDITIVLLGLNTFGSSLGRFTKNILFDKNVLGIILEFYRPKSIKIKNAKSITCSEKYLYALSEKLTRVNLKNFSEKSIELPKNILEITEIKWHQNFLCLVPSMSDHIILLDENLRYIGLQIVVNPINIVMYDGNNINSEDIFDICFSGKNIYYGNSLNNITKYNTQTHRESHKTMDETFFSIGIQERTLWAVASGNKIYSIDLKTSEKKELKINFWVNFVLILPFMNKLVLQRANSLVIIDQKTGKIESKISFKKRELPEKLQVCANNDVFCIFKRSHERIYIFDAKNYFRK